MILQKQISFRVYLQREATLKGVCPMSGLESDAISYLFCKLGLLSPCEPTKLSAALLGVRILAFLTCLQFETRPDNLFRRYTTERTELQQYDSTYGFRSSLELHDITGGMAKRAYATSVSKDIHRVLLEGL